MQKHWASKTTKPDAIYLHAEVHALMRARYQLHLVHSLHVFRYDAHGNPAPAKPCPVCQQAIAWAKIKHVYFTCEDGIEYERH